MLRNPTKGFEDVIMKHFKLEKELILKQSEEWLKEAKPNSTHHELLRKQIDQLKLEFEKLENNNNNNNNEKNEKNEQTTTSTTTTSSSKLEEK